MHGSIKNATEALIVDQTLLFARELEQKLDFLRAEYYQRICNTKP